MDDGLIIAERGAPTLGDFVIIKTTKGRRPPMTSSIHRDDHMAVVDAPAGAHRIRPRPRERRKNVLRLVVHRVPVLIGLRRLLLDQNLG